MKRVKKLSIVFFTMLFCLSTVITTSASQIDKSSIDYIEKNIQNYIIELYKIKISEPNLNPILI